MLRRKLAEKSIATKFDQTTHFDQQRSSRFADLPQELRDWVFAFVLESNEPLRLVAGLPDTVKALSQISRAISADAARIFYFRNVFQVTIGYINGRPNLNRDVVRLDC